MALKRIAPPGSEPISLAEAKAHLRVDIDDDDALITGLIVAAREQAEHRTGRALITQVWELALDDFPEAEIELPRVPASSIVSVKYMDTSNLEQIVSSGSYGLDNYGIQHWIIPADGFSWPSTNGGANNVRVQFVAGYGVPSEVPESIKAWIKLAIGTWYDRRAAAAELQSYELPQHFVDGLLDPYRTYAL